LSTTYLNELNKLLYNSLGLVLMTKRLFYPLFKAAYKASFTQKNIEHAFEKARIWPVNSEKVISKLQTKVKTTQAETEPITPWTPLTSCSVRNIQKLYKASR
jgi:4'-phosphopantetheinyl transferase EntD